MDGQICAISQPKTRACIHDRQAAKPLPARHPNASTSVRLTTYPATISLGIKINPHASGEIFLVLRTRGLVFSALPTRPPRDRAGSKLISTPDQVSRQKAYRTEVKQPDFAQQLMWWL